MSLDEIITGAKKDYSSGGSYRNAYAPGTPEFNAYERGWMQALKQDTSPAFKQDVPSPPDQKPPPMRPEAPAVNLYALAKGRTGPRKP